MKRNSDNESAVAQAILFGVAAEIRALAYLFETQGIKANQIAELDMDQISHGIARILKSQARRVKRARSLLEQQNNTF